MATYRVHDLIAIASRLTGVSEDEIRGVSRFRHIVRIRQAIAHVAVSFGVHSTPQIGKAIGGRDHSTIIHANRTAKDIAKRDPEYAHFIALLKYEASIANPFLADWENQLELDMPKVFVPPKPKRPVASSPLRPMFVEAPEEGDAGAKFHAGISKGSDRLLAALQAA